MSEALLEAMAASVAFDEHAEVLGWAFATLAPAERARWAARLAAASESVGLETTGGGLAMASADTPDDEAFRSLVEGAYAAAGIGSCAGAALVRLGRA